MFVRASLTRTACSGRAYWPRMRMPRSRVLYGHCSNWPSADPDYMNSDAEDVHSFIESRLVELIGDTGKKVHTGRSRNDQVATAFRLWLREEIENIRSDAKNLQSALIAVAERHKKAVLPGYTHLQRAQPVLWAHWCLAYFEMLARDIDRLADVARRVNVLPLGSAALAGTSFNVDREAVAAELGFESVSANSLDAVSDRDFAVEFVGACSLIMVHLSRLAEDLIIYATAEFGFISAKRRRFDRFEPDAAEEEPGRFGTSAGQSRKSFRAPRRFVINT